MTKNDKYILTAESVTEGHPDKLCDTIADRVLDACLERDLDSRVACEVLATAGKILVAGEITTKTLPDIFHIVCNAVRETGYVSDYEVEICIHDQSPDITNAVDGNINTDPEPSTVGLDRRGGARERCEGDQWEPEQKRTLQRRGAGDQGIVYGYACRETREYLPLSVVLAHRITKGLTQARKTGQIPGLRPDGKAQVSIEYENGQPQRVAAVVVSCQHEEDVDLESLRDAVRNMVLKPAFWDFPLDKETRVFLNPGGVFHLGGFEADTGLTGRKLMVDTYGGFAPHGGGALSGKDGTKVDRSGAYMARYIAKNIVAARLAEKCTVSLAYAIGVEAPVMVQVDTHGTGKYPKDVLEKAIGLVFDLSPTGMIMTLGLTEPVFARFCNYGHFMHRDAPWEQTDCVELMLEASDLAAAGEVYE